MHNFVAISFAFLLLKCKHWKLEGFTLVKMSKSTENAKKKYSETYKWTDDEVVLLLTVTKDYNAKQMAKSGDWESCVKQVCRQVCVPPRQALMVFFFCTPCSLLIYF